MAKQNNGTGVLAAGRPRRSLLRLRRDDILERAGRFWRADILRTLASVGLPSWLGWADDMLRAVMVLFLGLAGYGVYRERKKAIATGKANAEMFEAV